MFQRGLVLAKNPFAILARSTCIPWRRAACPLLNHCVESWCVEFPGQIYVDVHASTSNPGMDASIAIAIVVILVGLPNPARLAGGR